MSVLIDQYFCMKHNKRVYLEMPNTRGIHKLKPVQMHYGYKVVLYLLYFKLFKKKLTLVNDFN